MCYGANAPGIRLATYTDGELPRYLGHGWYDTTDWAAMVSARLCERSERLAIDWDDRE